MRFLLDQDVYAATARFIDDLGHDVALAATLGLSRASDSDLLQTAHQQQRIMITRDRHFGGLVFLRNFGAGVIYLRIPPATLKAGHKELRRVLNSYSEEDLQAAFVTVEPGRHRFRKLSR